jgi:hypothetical protein
VDLLISAADAALATYRGHWRRQFIEMSHGVIAKQRSGRMKREHISQQELDIEDVIRSIKVSA